MAGIYIGALSIMKPAEMQKCPIMATVIADLRKSLGDSIGTELTNQNLAFLVESTHWQLSVSELIQQKNWYFVRLIREKLVPIQLSVEEAVETST